MADKKYLTIKLLIEANQVTAFSGIFEYVSKSRVAKDLGMHYSRFNRKLKDIGDFKLEQLYQLAALIGIEEITMIRLVCNEIGGVRAAKKKVK